MNIETRVPPGESSRTPSRIVPHTPPGTCRSNEITPGRGQSARDVEDDRLPPWWENGLKKRAIAADRTASA